MFFVKKKDGSLRLVQDYCKLNEVTIKNSYPLPLISDILTCLQGAKWFSTLDLHWGFNNVQIKEGDEWKAALTTNHGLFKPTVMFFGLCNSPATFQTMMNDILIFSCTLKEHRKTVWEVLAMLRKRKLFLKPEKCKFEKRTIEYLGLVISEDHIAMDPVKVKGVTDWPAPMKVKEVQSFLSFINFYWQFICDFSQKACPLHRLTWKTQRWAWGPPEQEAFESLKRAIMTTPVLTFPLDSTPFCLECDASNFAMGVVLSQLQANGEFHPMAFMSKGFSDTEQNYKIYDKEMLAIVRALEEWHHFLEGTPKQFIIFMDHQNLAHFCLAQSVTTRHGPLS